MDQELERQLEQAQRIAAGFDLPDPVRAFDFPAKGNINRKTYLITAGMQEFLLQQLNPDIFMDPAAVMNGMIRCIQAQQKALSAGLIGSDEWEPVRLIPARDGKMYLERSGPSGPECWRMMARVREAASYKSLREIGSAGGRLHIAEEAGRGLALFGVLTAGMDVSKIACPLPGYRDTELYYNQLLSAVAGCRTLSEAESYLPRDPGVRRSTERHFLIHIDSAEYRRRLKDPQLRRFISLALDQKPFGLTLAAKLASGELRKTVIHGDTKLDNFLFSTRTGKVKAIVDLDTIMPHTWLSDWGDMVRSLVNVAGERETDLGRIGIDEEVYEALARGFRGSAQSVDPRELDLMADAPRIMALELGIRFLADYLRGDSYFRPEPDEPPDLNKTRAMVQFRVFELLSEKQLSAASRR